MNTQNNEQDSLSDRPLGYWLRTVDGLLTREFFAAFEGEGVTRRDWMLLNLLSGDIEIPGLAERIARKGKRLRGLADRGWAEEQGDGTWTLTDEGRAAKARLGGIVDSLRERVAGAVSPEDFATTTASLEAIARELGWDETDSDPRRGFGRRFGGFGPGFGPGARGLGFGAGFGPGFGAGGRDFGRGFGRGFGPDGRDFGRGFGPGFGPGHGFAHRPGFGAGHGFGHRPGFGPDADADEAEREGCRSHEGHRGHPGHRHGGRRHAEHAYERGFDAGYSRGRDA